MNGYGRIRDYKSFQKRGIGAKSVAMSAGAILGIGALALGASGMYGALRGMGRDDAPDDRYGAIVQEYSALSIEQKTDLAGLVWKDLTVADKTSIVSLDLGTKVANLCYAGIEDAAAKR